MAQAAGIVPRASLLVADEVAHLGASYPLHRPLTVTHADGGQVGPGDGMTNPFGGMQHRIAAILLAPMTTLARLIDVVVQAGEIGIESLPEGLLDVFEEVFLVVLD